MDRIECHQNASDSMLPAYFHILNYFYGKDEYSSFYIYYFRVMKALFIIKKQAIHNRDKNRGNPTTFPLKCLPKTNYNGKYHI